MSTAVPGTADPSATSAVETTTRIRPRALLRACGGHRYAVALAVQTRCDNKAGIRPITIHDARRTCPSLLVIMRGVGGRPLVPPHPACSTRQGRSPLAGNKSTAAW
jgi:hypothetical protein